jgi:hypothetical protein
MSDPIEPAKNYFKKTYENIYGKSSDEPTPDFARLFTDQVLVQPTQTGFAYNIVRNYYVGDLNIPSGKLVACDPGTYPDPHETTFDLTVTPGEYPVYITVVHMPFYGGSVGMARVQFSETRPIEWKPGMDNYCQGFGTDMASGCFMDANLAKYIQEQLEADESHNKDYATSEKIMDRLREYGKVNRDSWANVIVYDESTNANIISFKTGLGDGGYPCYIGYDQEGQLTCALADFWIHDIETASDWSVTGFPPIPHTFGDDFFKWVAVMLPHLKQPTISLEPLVPEDATSLFTGKTIPADLVLYYQHISPWTSVDDPHTLWRQALAHVHSDEPGNVIHYQVKADVHFLPLNLSSLDPFDVVILDKNKYILATIRNKPPGFGRDYRIIEAVFYQCDLQTYILKRVLAGLKTNVQ